MKRTLMLCLFLAALPLYAEVSSTRLIIPSDKEDLSPPLREIAPAAGAAGVRRMIPNSEVRYPESQQAPLPGQLDPVIQTWFGPASIPATTQNFDGISASCCIPPDTSGDVGLNHYVQVVNTQFSVFTKSGSLVYGPVNTNTLWSGFGGLCESTNFGDGIVIYDSIANRWIISQFAYQVGGAHLECVAISKTSDPTGSYYRYSFSFPLFNDYPKWGVWPDGYYTTYTLRQPDFSTVEGYACAFDRNRMLSGAPATAQCFSVGANYTALLAADLDGSTLPPAGTPNFLMNLGVNSLNLWRFRINWTTPSASSLTGPFAVPVAAFNNPCKPSRTCVPQTGTTSQLDSFGDRLMFRLGYRNFGSYQSLVANHTVDAGSGITGIRWYEIRNPNGTPSVFQQGTYSPNINFRWMGSIGMDKMGNIGVGYSISGNNIHPGIRYAGRLVGDPPGTLSQGEGIIRNGSGSQSSSRWGDYSQMTIDPTDECAFWYTTEYLSADGSFNWHTRIASFRFPNCAPCTATSQLLANPGFESGSINWTASPATIINNTNGAYPPHSGNWKAQLNGKGTANTATLYQAVAIPSNACTANFTFWLRIATAETTTTVANDTLKIQVLDSAGKLLADLAVFSNLNKSNTYSQKSFSLLPYKGQTIRLRFLGSENGSRQTTFLVDDTAARMTK